MKAIQDGAAFFFIAAVAILSVISVLGVWEFFARDVISKSFQTLGLLAVVSIVVIIAGRYIDSRHAGQGTPAYVPNPAFGLFRKITLAILIMLAAVLALLGVMAIWDVISDKDALWKSVGSLAVLAFGAFIIVLTCVEREKLPTAGANGTALVSSPGRTIGITAALLFAAWVVMAAWGGMS